MKFRYHVITPFTRFENLVEFSRMLKSIGVSWHPVFNNDLPFGIHGNEWIESLYCPIPTPGFNAGNFAINWFFDHGYIMDDDRYMMLADDDFYEPGFLEKIDSHSGELIVCSMLRGHNQPSGGTPYGTGTLTACPENMHVGAVGMEQAIFKGSVLREMRLGPENDSDGRAIVDIASRHAPDFAPEANVWFNYLQPGRWNR
jgi:hypothetical protein